MSKGKMLVIEGPKPEDISPVMRDMRFLLLNEHIKPELHDFLVRIYEELRKG